MRIDKSLLVPPGEHVTDMLESRGIDIATARAMIDIEPETFDKLLTGDAPVTPEIADVLAKFFQTKPRIWLMLEKIYQRDLMMVRAHNDWQSW